MRKVPGVSARNWPAVTLLAVVLCAVAARSGPDELVAGQAVAGGIAAGIAAGSQQAGPAGLVPSGPARELLVRAGVRLRECDPDGARDLCVEALRRSATDSSAGEEAIFRIAQIDYMAGRIDSAIAGFDSLARRFPEGGLVNDSLELALFLEDGLSEAPGDIKAVGASILAVHCGQLDNATGALDSLASHSSLGDRILLIKCELERQGARYGAAVASLERLIAGFGGSRLLPKARHMLGRVYEEDINASDTAIDVYERLIVDYPESPYADDARLRIERLKAAKAARQGT